MFIGARNSSDIFAFTANRIGTLKLVVIIGKGAVITVRVELGSSYGSGAQDHRDTDYRLSNAFDWMGNRE